MLIGGTLKRVKVCMDCLSLYKKKEKLRVENLELQKKTAVALKPPKVKEEEKIVEHAKIPEEVVLEMKQKSKVKKTRTSKSDDLDLVEEIMSESLQKESKKKK